MPEALPSYSEVDAVPSPAYSSEARFVVERITRQGTPSDDVWTYKTQHMEVNLGAREAWSRRMPAYGLNGIVQGYIKLKGAQEHVRQVTAMVGSRQHFSSNCDDNSFAFQLDGTITISSLDRGMITGRSETPLLSRKMSLYVHRENNPPPWAEKSDFAMPFPNEVNLVDAITALPPSFLLYHAEISVEVAYSLTFDMVRKGLRRHQR
jgi:hypothetical protein